MVAIFGLALACGAELEFRTVLTALGVSSERHTHHGLGEVVALG